MQVKELSKTYFAAPFAEKYKEIEKYPAPDDYRDIKTKSSDEPYFIAKAEEMWSSYINGRSFFGPSEVNDMIMDTLYAEGRQPIAKYERQYTIKAKNDQERRTLSNVSKDVLPIMIKLINIMMSKYNKVSHGMSAMAVDDFSCSEREDLMQDIMLEEYEGPFLQMMEQAIGRKRMENQNLPFQPRTKQDIEMLKAMDSFKLDIEILYEQLLKGTADRCGWEETEKRMTMDGVKIGYMASKNYIDPVNKKPSVRYVDPRKSVCRVANEDDPENREIIEYGEQVWYTLADLRAAGLSKEQIKKCVNTWGGQYGNPVNRWDAADWKDINLKSYRCMVLDADFMSLDTEFKEIREKEGKKIVFDLPHDSTSEKSIKNGNQFVSSTYPKRYQFKWVVGTDVVFDYGYQDTMTYKDDKPLSNYSIYRVGKRSIVNQCISVLDDLQEAIIKLRIAVRKARPSGLKIEIGSLATMEIDKRKVSPWELIKIFDITGNIFYKGVLQPNGTYTTQGSTPPVDTTTGGIGPVLNELLLLIQTYIATLREITGLNITQDASSPTPNLLVGTAKIAAEATDNSLQYVMSARKALKATVFQKTASMWELVMLLSMNPVSEYYQAFPGAPVQIIKLNNKDGKRKIRIIVDTDIDQEEQMIILDKAEKSMQAAKAGQVGITMTDFLFIMMAVRRGRLKYAMTYLAYREDLMRQQQAAVAQQASAENAKQQEAADQRKIAFEMQKINAEADAKIKVAKETEKEKRETLTLQHSQEMEKIAATPRPEPALAK